MNTNDRPQGILSTVALIVTVLGAVGSLFFMFRAGQNTPPLLLVAFVFWVISPFAFLLWASKLAKRWSVPIRITLYAVAIIVSLSSLAIYSGMVDVKPAGSANAFLFVAVPPVSLILSALIVGLARIVLARQLPS